MLPYRFLDEKPVRGKFKHENPFLFESMLKHKARPGKRVLDGGGNHWPIKGKYRPGHDPWRKPVSFYALKGIT